MASTRNMTTSTVDLPGIYHPTLSSYFPLIIKLEEYITHHIGVEEWYHIVAVPGPTSLGEFLSGTLVALETQGLQDISSERKQQLGEVYLTQQELVDRSLVQIARRPGKLNELNVLTAGFRRADTLGGLAPNVQRLGLDSQQANSQVALILNGPEWSLLHERLGTSFMEHLFTHPYLAIFLPLQNNCFTQLCGRPLYMIEPICKVEERALKRKRRVEKEMAKQLSRYKRKKMKAADREIDGSSANPTEKGSFTVPQEETIRTEAEKFVLEQEKQFARPPVMVEIVRNRMFYGKWGWRGDKRLPGVGLPVNHILNNLTPPVKIRTLPSSAEERSQIPKGHHDPDWAPRTLLRYIFPREHGLHNVFTSPPSEDKATGNEPKDRYGNWKVEPGKAAYRSYEDRKDEIEAAIAVKSAKTPRRMKGEMLGMMKQIIARHKRCDYRRIRDAYCPSKTKNRELSADTQGAAACAISSGQVGRFALAVCRFVFPEAFWGSTDNARHMRNHVVGFVRARRYETFSVHQLLQGYKCNDCSWLGAGPNGGKVSVDEARKRMDLTQELVYWFFDSFLVPLLKTTFYITETATTKYRTSYFRQDDWDTLCQPMIQHLTSTVYYRMPESRQRYLRKHKPAHATIRLIPKPNGMRPICNLGKKQRVVTPAGSIQTKYSINDNLADAHHALTFEKRHQSQLLSSSLFGLYDIYGKLKTYKATLTEAYGEIPPLYFVKTDIRAAFDTLNQEKLLVVAAEVLRRDGDYVARKHVQMLPLSGRAPLLWKKHACPESMLKGFSEESHDFSQKLQNAVFIDQADSALQVKHDIFRDLFDHVRHTHIRFGKDYYKQDTGIPQGSKVSSLLCSYFYGHMESQLLRFAAAEDCLLMRIIDDFIFITPRKDQAELFLHTMNEGSDEYGCHVSLEKSLCNFASQHRLPIPMTTEDQPFPYCGTLIDTRSLDLRIDIKRSYGIRKLQEVVSVVLILIDFDTEDVREILSVKWTRTQGASFSAWIKRMLENHNHMIYNDTGLSSFESVCSNIYTNFLLTAMKTVHYLGELDHGLGVNDQFIYSKSLTVNVDSGCNEAYTVRFGLLDAIDAAVSHTANANRAHIKSYVGTLQAARCDVPNNTFVWIAKHAFARIMREKGDKWETVRTVFEEDLRHHRCLQLSKDRRLRKIMRQTWEDVSKVTF